MEAGAANKSYGIEVARLAGLPKAVVERAREVLRVHEKAESQQVREAVPAKERVPALQMTMFTLLPSILLSGFVFAREGMPAVFQLISLLIPMTYYLQILRGIMLKGVGLSVLWQQALALSLFAAAVLGLAVSRFRKRVD